MYIKKIWTNSGKWILDNPYKFYLVVLLLLTLILIYLDYISQFLTTGSICQKEQDWRSVLTEIHGMWFDILILGLLFTVYEKLRNKNEIEKTLDKERIEKINSFNSQIGYLKDLKSDEARYKIRENIIELNKLTYTKFNLSKLTLKGLNFLEINFNHSTLVETDLSDSNLVRCQFSAIECFSSKFNNALLASSDFSKSHFQVVEFKKASLVESDFSDANLISANFEGADLRGIILKNTHFNNCNFEGAEVNEDFIERLQKWNTFGNPICEMYEVKKTPVQGYEAFRFIARKKANYNDLLKILRPKPKNTEGVSE